MNWTLDSNAVIAFLRGKSAFLQRLQRHAPADVFLSSITLHELMYGAFRSDRVDRTLARLERMEFPVLPFDAEDAREAATIRAHLARQGTPIGPYDTLIAGHARARSLVLVTRNTREFSRVPGLTIEDWEAP